MRLEELLEFVSPLDFNKSQVQQIIDYCLINTGTLQCQMLKSLQTNDSDDARIFLNTYFTGKVIEYNVLKDLVLQGFTFDSIPLEQSSNLLTSIEKQQLGKLLLEKKNDYAGFYLLTIDTQSEAEDAFAIIESIYQNKEKLQHILKLTELILKFNKCYNYSLESDLFNRCIEELIIYQIQNQ
ncbi:hypothetical protein SS50377_22322 [Spironucleus salmonicida]|uniref:Uncharacterized protein n=1 Tax=Spironucleus salmonicida TaxID=348837 RepID=V6LN90_9EUKA|nr:hypothetical protein SS50377_22322 [Spironucleus salmonicida]|eukprot:EST42184.1 Hypothetical protein SS50377_18489 [Spironucleus salmonicida]